MIFSKYRFDTLQMLIFFYFVLANIWKYWYWTSNGMHSIQMVLFFKFSNNSNYLRSVLWIFQ